MRITTSCEHKRMKGLYGSTAAPKEVFGDLTPVFYKTLNEECPGAIDLLEMLRAAWNDEVDRNTWQLPDGHLAMVPITEKVESRIHVAQLKYTPVVTHQVVGPQEYGVSLIANVVHSIDAYVLRTMVRRLNYKPKQVRMFLIAMKRFDGKHTSHESSYTDVWYSTGVVDMTMIEATDCELLGFPTAMRRKLIDMLEMCLEHMPFELILIHDSFACHPVNCNQLRKCYAHILADICDSTLIDDLLNQVYQCKDTVEKYGDTKALAAIIRESNYGIS